MRRQGISKYKIDDEKIYREKEWRVKRQWLEGYFDTGAREISLGPGWSLRKPNEYMDEKCSREKVQL